MFRHPFNYRGVSTNEMERLRREMNRLFSGFSTPTTRDEQTYPAMNIWANEDGAEVTAELPGVNPDNIDLTITGDTLSISGKRESNAIGEGIKYHRRERGQGAFTRTVQLPFSIEEEKVDAAFEDGVLHIMLPRAEADKPRKIRVKAA